MHERRKGEPSTRGSALRKVYRRGFVAHDADGEQAEYGEVEVEEEGEDHSRRVEVGEEIAHAAENQEAAGVSRRSEWTQEVEGVVARSGTPPLHARVERHHCDDIPDVDNPWA